MATLLWALGASLLMGLIFIGLATFAPDLRGAEDDGAHALSHSAVGFAGIVRLLKETGTPVNIRRGAAPLEGHAALLVLTPPAGVDAKAVRSLTLPYKGPTLIIAPKWVTSRSPRHLGWAVVDGLLPPPAAAAAVARPEIEAVNRSGGVQPLVLVGGPYQHMIGPEQSLKFGPIRSLQSHASDTGMSILQDAHGAAVLVGVGDGRTFVLTEPDLLDNHALANPDAARSAMALIDLLRQGGPVVFDVTLNGLGRPRSLMQTALTPPFFAATLCALFALALTGWRAVARFGPTIRPGRAVALGKRALVDNAAGLIRLTRREARMAPRYAAVTRNAVARAVGAPRDSSVEQTNAYLDKLGDPTGETTPFSDLVAAADASGGNKDALMRSARNLYTWKAEIIGGRS
jgi:hypothetical protein